MKEKIKDIVYIPVWIDQKHQIYYHNKANTHCLHSSMDRLETRSSRQRKYNRTKFTFQYGQIRNQAHLVIISLILKCLHSSMDRLETIVRRYYLWYRYYVYIPVWIDQKQVLKNSLLASIRVYIPVWIDQKLMNRQVFEQQSQSLHSSMDRLETRRTS